MNVPEFHSPVYTYRAELVRVVDADTIDVRLDVGFDTHIFKRLRFLAFDAWETRGEEREKGLVAKERLESLIRSSNQLYVQTIMDGEGKFGRVLAWVWIETFDGPKCINQILLEEGHGTELPV
jgi:micrococcal nuclease